MDAARVRELIDGFANVAARADSARRLARFVGAEALFVLVHDADIRALIPANGFPKTFAGGPRWHSFLDAARQSRRHCGVVAYPTIHEESPAASWTIGAAVFVFVGGAVDEERVAVALQALPVAAALFAAEYAAFSVRGELKAAQDHARQAEILAKALDGARAQVARGIADLQRQTHALVEAGARAEDAARAKDEFLAMLGHELRNPLAPIVTALELLRQKNIWSREHDVIERQVANMRRLIDDLLDISRITRGRIELRRHVEELSTLVTDAVQMAAAELERKRQTLQISVPREGLRVNADHTRLVQVITNLLTNASKYSDAGTSISIAGERHGETARLSVRDEGIGLPADMLTRVFDLFVQNPQSLDRAQGGLGLGLAIVHSLVTLHGGRVWAESAGAHHGSTFVIELPLSHAPVLAAAPQLAGAQIGSKTRRHERVLVVDDNEDARNVLSEALTSVGYTVMTAGDGPTALNIASQFQPHVAILDIGLPVMDGYELARHLRQRGSQRLIAVTGYGQDSDRRRAFEAGFDAHFVKPIVIDELVGALRIGRQEHTA